MKQSRLTSLVESIANVVVGYGVAVVTQIPIFWLHTTSAQNLQMGAIFTLASIARSFALRRLFEAIRVHSHWLRRTMVNPLATFAPIQYDDWKERVFHDGRQTGALGRRLRRAI